MDGQGTLFFKGRGGAQRGRPSGPCHPTLLGSQGVPPPPLQCGPECTLAAAPRFRVRRTEMEPWSQAAADFRRQAAGLWRWCRGGGGKKVMDSRRTGGSYQPLGCTQDHRLKADLAYSRINPSSGWDILAWLIETGIEPHPGPPVIRGQVHDSITSHGSGANANLTGYENHILGGLRFGEMSRQTFVWKKIA